MNVIIIIILKFVACAKWVFIVPSLSFNNFLDLLKNCNTKFNDKI